MQCITRQRVGQVIIAVYSLLILHSAEAGVATPLRPPEFDGERFTNPTVNPQPTAPVPVDIGVSKLRLFYGYPSAGYVTTEYTTPDLRMIVGRWVQAGCSYFVKPPLATARVVTPIAPWQGEIRIGDAWSYKFVGEQRAGEFFYRTPAVRLENPGTYAVTCRAPVGGYSLDRNSANNLVSAKIAVAIVYQQCPSELKATVGIEGTSLSPASKVPLSLRLEQSGVRNRYGSGAYTDPNTVVCTYASPLKDVTGISREIDCPNAKLTSTPHKYECRG